MVQPRPPFPYFAVGRERERGARAKTNGRLGILPNHGADRTAAFARSFVRGASFPDRCNKMIAGFVARPFARGRLFARLSC